MYRRTPSSGVNCPHTQWQMRDLVSNKVDSKHPGLPLTCKHALWHAPTCIYTQKHAHTHEDKKKKKSVSKKGLKLYAMEGIPDLHVVGK